MRLTRLYPDHYFYLAIALMLGLAWLLPIAVVIDGYGRLIALVPICGGAYLAVDANRRFMQAATSILPFDHSTALVTSGPFQLTRNPIYLGMGLILAGIALALGSLGPWLPVIGFFVVIDRLFVPFEEQMLALNFGPDYEAYRQKVRRWV